MRYFKSIVVAFSFISSLVGAGLATGKEVALFLGEANVISVVLCGLAIALFSYPFILLGITGNGDTLNSLFGKNKNWGIAIVKFINFIFLCAMLGGAETLLKEICGFSGGAFFMALLTLISIEFGNNFIKTLNTIVTPLILLALLFLYLKTGNKPTGRISVLLPLLYAGMNTANAGIFAGTLIKDFSQKDAVLVSAIIFVGITLILLIVKTLIVGYESNPIPLYSVSKDTDLPIFSALIIFFAILTSCISSLSLCSKKHTLEPYIICSIALLFSFIGFDRIIKTAYPLLGVLGIMLLITAIYRLILLKLNLQKSRNLGL